MWSGGYPYCLPGPEWARIAWVALLSLLLLACGDLVCRREVAPARSALVVFAFGALARGAYPRAPSGGVMVVSFGAW